MAVLVIQHYPCCGATGLCADKRTDIRNDAFAFNIDGGRSYGGLLPELKHVQIFRIDGDLRPYCRYIGYGKDGRILLQCLTLSYSFAVISPEMGARIS